MPSLRFLPHKQSCPAILRPVGIAAISSVPGFVLICLFLVLPPPAARGQVYHKLHTFTGAPRTGANPASLTVGKDGMFYGCNAAGGNLGFGTLFRMDTNGVISTLHTFNGIDGADPVSRLLQATDGGFYGGTVQGGSHNHGVLYKIDANGAYSVLYSFRGSDGAGVFGGLVQGKDGMLYGVTEAGGNHGFGTVFRFDPVSRKLTTLHVFARTDGAYPEATLLLAKNGLFYGTTRLGGGGGFGTLFQLNGSTGAVTTLYGFSNADGANLDTGVIQGKDGLLYGVTPFGGANQYGTLFRYDLAKNKLTTLYNFAGTDGASPEGLLTQAQDGGIIGETSSGGTNGFGAVFRFDVTAGKLSLLDSFTGSDGAQPAGGLIQTAKGAMYGVTQRGGAANYGSVFKLASNNAVVSIATLGNYQNDGAQPGASPVQDASGILYGTTRTGGAFNAGTLYRYTPVTATYLTLYAFRGPDGAGPAANLIQGKDGFLYGTTTEGGAANHGTIFQFNAATKTLKSLYSFMGSDGVAPASNLVQTADGTLYGVTQRGGTSGVGVLFRLDIGHKTVVTLADFGGANGDTPNANLLLARDGSLYGTTMAGGASGYGTIFRFDFGSGSLSAAHSFSGPDGVTPAGGLLQANDGFLYGTTYGFAPGPRASTVGTLFRYDSLSTNLKTLYHFDVTAGVNPVGSLIQVQDGLLYGTTVHGGTNNDGTVFRFDPTSGIAKTLVDCNTSVGIRPPCGLFQATDAQLYGVTSGGGGVTGTSAGVFFAINTSKPAATNVTTSFSVSRSGLLLDPTNLQYTGTLTVTNSSKKDMSGPLTLVFNGLPAHQFLMNASGANATTPTVPFITVAGVVRAGASIHIPVVFNTVSATAYTLTIYNGLY